VHHRQHLEHRRRHRHGAIDAALSFLQRLKNNRASGEVDALADELQGLGDPAPGVGEDVAKGPDQAVLVVGRGEKFLPFGIGEVGVTSRKGSLHTLAAAHNKRNQLFAGSTKFRVVCE
jgi:hypothetical protein